MLGLCLFKYSGLFPMAVAVQQSGKIERIGKADRSITRPWDVDYLINQLIS